MHFTSIEKALESVTIQNMVTFKHWILPNFNWQEESYFEKMNAS